MTTLNNRTASSSPACRCRSSRSSAAAAVRRTLNAPVTVERIQTGVTLQVTPSVTNNRQIMMRVETTNSDVNFTNDGTLIDNNSNKNELLVADGETVVIAGLTQTSVRVTKSGIPLLVDLPIIGRLFGYTTRQEQRRDLLILITPHIIDEGQSPSDAGAPLGDAGASYEPDPFHRAALRARARRPAHRELRHATSNGRLDSLTDDVKRPTVRFTLSTGVNNTVDVGSPLTVDVRPPTTAVSPRS